MVVLWCGGCASVSNLDAALEEPAEAARSASAVAEWSERDVLELVALGTAKYEGQLELPSLICSPAIGPDVVVSNLRTFADSLAAIDAVATKPKNASLAATLARIREDDKAGAKDYESERRAAIKKRDAGRARCAALFGNDIDASTHIMVPPPGGGGGAELAASATFAAIDALATAIAQAVEQLKRDEAVKAAVRQLAPQMQAAVSSLEAPRNSGFGPQVAYTIVGSPAETMNRTSLGAAISLHRWWVAKRIEALWNELGPCRAKNAAVACVRSAHMRETAHDLSAAVSQYRALALIDTDKVIKLLQNGVTDAQNALEAKTPSRMIDSLYEIGGALSSIDKTYHEYQETRR